MRNGPIKFTVAGLGLAAFGFAATPSARADHATDSASPDAIFQMMDTNGDGKISVEEHAAGARRMFQTMDADKDGKVTASEMEAAHDQLTNLPQPAGTKNNPPDKTNIEPTEKSARSAAGNLGPRASGMTQMSAAEKLKVVDTNNDGVISPDEHVAASRRMFDRMDTNNDGYLSKSELAAGHARLMSKPNNKK